MSLRSIVSFAVVASLVSFTAMWARADVTALPSHEDAVLAAVDGVGDDLATRYFLDDPLASPADASDAAWESVEASEPMPRRLAAAWLELNAEWDDSSSELVRISTPEGTRWVAIIIRSH